MPIKASTSREVDGLVRDLRADHALTRDAAVARLTVIGARAVQKLLGVALDVTADVAARLAALRALEGIADTRALGPALDLLNSETREIQIGSISVVRAFLQSPAHGVHALDRLTSLALDASAASDVRVAALRAVADLGAATAAPLLTQLKDDPDARIAAATRNDAGRAASPAQRLVRAAAGDLGEDPAALRAAIVRDGANAAVTTLHSIVEHVARKEKDSGARRTEWQAVRGAAHLALAHHGSRLALYDLRESLTAEGHRLPLDFLSALTLVGDASCLEPIAAAYAAEKSDP
ncbi:MAG: hypothetical protein LBQ09_12370, partial [Acidobacteriaceae bacterium]|nr:hypothetical protein [Acidobacteriaceae bacterium]